MKSQHNRGARQRISGGYISSGKSVVMSGAMLAVISICRASQEGLYSAILDLIGISGVYKGHGVAVSLLNMFRILRKYNLIPNDDLRLYSYYIVCWMNIVLQ